jgi:hypothetical protein
MLEQLMRAAEHVSTMKAATVGAGGATVSILAAAIDPGQAEPWLRLATLFVGLLTGLGSGGLLFLKYYDRWHNKD